MTSETLLNGDWSAPVTDNRGFALRGRLVVRVRPRDRGQREAAVFVELQDASQMVHGGMRVLFNPEGLRCTLHDSQKRPVPAAGFVFGGATPTSTWVELPADATVRLRVSPFGVWVPGALAICPHPGTQWRLDPRAKGAFQLAGTFTVTPEGAPPVSDPQIWRGALTLPPVAIPPLV